jgi:predicted dinucleotide-binding enzyme
MVGQAIGTKLVQAGNHVTMGSRSASNESALAWAAPLGERATCATFAGAAAAGEIAFDCTSGAHSVRVLGAVEPDLRGKILIHVGNPLDFSRGMPPSLTVCNTDSLGEQAQRALPATHVVKALNTMNCDVMVDPALVPGDHHLFLCGNDARAKASVTRHLHEWFGWKPANVIDLGDITASRGMEMILPLWLRIWQVLGDAHFNVRVMHGG